MSAALSDIGHLRCRATSLRPTSSAADTGAAALPSDEHRPSPFAVARHIRPRSSLDAPDEAPRPLLLHSHLQSGQWCGGRLPRTPDLVALPSFQTQCSEKPASKIGERLSARAGTGIRDRFAHWHGEKLMKALAGEFEAPRRGCPRVTRSCRRLLAHQKRSQPEATDLLQRAVLC